MSVSTSSQLFACLCRLDVGDVGTTMPFKKHVEVAHDYYHDDLLGHGSQSPTSGVAAFRKMSYCQQPDEE